MDPYLETSEYIDWQTPSVLTKAKDLAGNSSDDLIVANACFEFVRDQIRHSWDFQLNPVTLKASDVLRHATGYCYAKSHLLAALLRANGIPTALCYQRLTFENDRPPFCLHGLNAVYLQKYGWYRIDARGNKEGVEAEFDPPNEKLAFEIRNDGESDLDERFSRPHPEVVRVLSTYCDFREVAENLPDVDVSI